jgi:hypothetical protein
MSTDFVERGKRVAESRWSRLPPGSWEVHALKSEIESLHSIAEAKDAELTLMRKQLQKTTRLLESTTSHSVRPVELVNPPAPSLSATAPFNPLLESFSSCSHHKLDSTLRRIQQTTHATSLDELRDSVARLHMREKQYTELFDALCRYLRIRPHEETHASVMQRLKSSVVAAGSSGGVAWTLPLR